MLSDKKILFTGGTGLVARPGAEAMAKDNEVWCAQPAVPAEAEAIAELESQGIKTFDWRMGDSLDGLPDDFTHVFHAAHARLVSDYNDAAQVSSVGVGSLMYHCRTVESFLFISSFGVYVKPPTREFPVPESFALGGHAPYAPAYPTAKLSAEGVVRALSSVLGIKSIICRLNTIYGPNSWGGVAIEYFTKIVAGEPLWTPTDGTELWASPICTDDLVRLLPGLWDAASTSPTIVNLAGDDAVSNREFAELLAAKAGLDVSFVKTAESRDSFVSDNTYRKSLVGDCQVDWREGIPRMVEAHYPGAFDPARRGELEVKPNVWGQR